MRGRGLKLFLVPPLLAYLGSPPMRGRGLKQQYLSLDPAELLVAPHAGAWIETKVRLAIHEIADGRPPCGGVD